MLRCGQFCGTLEQCLYFFLYVGRSCLICLNGTHNNTNHLDEWSGEVVSDTKIWSKEKGPTYFIGYNPLVNDWIADEAKKYGLVDLTPVPTRSKLVRFIFNAGAVNREIRFGVYRKDGNQCDFTLVHQWITISNRLGLNEYYTGYFIVEKGYHIGFTFTQYGVIRYTDDSVKRYCGTRVAPTVNVPQGFKKHSIGYRKYLFQGKFTAF